VDGTASLVNDGRFNVAQRPIPPLEIAQNLAECILTDSILTDSILTDSILTDYTAGS